jgi:hypothetical protein
MTPKRMSRNRPLFVLQRYSIQDIVDDFELERHNRADQATPKRITSKKQALK